MSVRAELEELVKWISELSAKDKPPPDQQPLEHEIWQGIGRNLVDASETFAEVRTALLKSRPQPFLGEFAGDLEHDADSLASRARLLSRRAPHKDKSESTKASGQRPPADGRSAAREGTEEPHHTQTATQPTPAEQVQAATGPGKRADTSRDGAAELKTMIAKRVESAGRTVETAHQKLGPLEDLDPVSKAFEEELDVLAEMTLWLHQQCDPAGDQKVAEVKRRWPTTPSLRRAAQPQAKS